MKKNKLNRLQAGYTIHELLVALFGLVGVSIFLGGIYVAIHFITKFW